MFKKTLLLAAVLATIPCAAFARIDRSVDNSLDAIVYATSKKITRWSTVDILDFKKTTRQNGDDNFIITVQFGGPGRDKMFAQNYGYIIIDEVEHQVEKLTYSYPMPGKKRKPGICEVTYVVPPEVMAKIGSFDNHLQFKFGMQGKEYTVFNISRKEQEEIRLIANLKFADFENLGKGLIKIREIK